MAYENSFQPNETYIDLGRTYGTEAAQTMTVQTVPLSRVMTATVLNPAGGSRYAADRVYKGTVAMYNPDFHEKHKCIQTNAAAPIVAPNLNVLAPANVTVGEFLSNTELLGVYIEDSSPDRPMSTVAVSGVVDVVNNSGVQLAPLQTLRVKIPLHGLDQNAYIPPDTDSAHASEVYPLLKARTSVLPPHVAVPVIYTTPLGKGGVDDFDAVVRHTAAASAATAPPHVRHLSRAFDLLDSVHGNPAGTWRQRFSSRNVDKTKFKHAMQCMMHAIDADRRSILGKTLSHAKHGQYVRVALKSTVQ